MRRLAWSLLVLVASEQVSAGNLILNSRFSDGIQLWDSALPTDATFSWDPIRGVGTPTGSARLFSSTGPGFSQALFCAPTSPGDLNAWGSAFLFSAGSSPTGGFLALRFFASSDCSGSALYLVQSPSTSSALSAAETWIQVAGPEVVSPSGASSVQFTVVMTMIEATGSYALNFDNPYFVNGPPTIPVLDGAGFAVLAGLVCVAAVARLRRGSRR